MSGSSPPGSFPIVVFGDSIMWGQGLNEAHKMAELVGAQLALQAEQGLVTDPEVIRFAHSGADLGTAPMSEFAASINGEVPGSSPTVFDQVASAATVLARVSPQPIETSTVRLVLVNGGINDVGLSTLLDPTQDSATIAASASALQAPMTTVLETIAQQFPNAVVVLPGYYQFLSSSSDVVGIALVVGVLIGGLIPALVQPGGWVVGLLAGEIPVATVQSMIDNCSAFKSVSDAAFQNAVDASNAATKPFIAPNQTPMDRFLFVPSPLQSGNAVFPGDNNGDDRMSQTAPALLWGFNPTPDAIVATIASDTTSGSLLGGLLSILTGGLIDPLTGTFLGASQGAQTALNSILDSLEPVDEVGSQRERACARHAAPADMLFCNLASLGHPNIEGEAAYADAIFNTIIPMFVPPPKLVAVPNVVGDTLAQANIALSSFSVTLLDVSVTKPRQVGVVLTQWPLAGTRAIAGSTVTINIGVAKGSGNKGSAP